MHSDRIWSNLRLQRIFVKTLSLKHAFWRYWKRVATAEKILKTKSLYIKHAFWRLTIWNYRQMKTKSLKHALWRDVKRFGIAEKNENKDGKWCLLTVFRTIWNFYVKTCGCSPLTPYLPSSFKFNLLHFWVF